MASMAQRLRELVSVWRRSAMMGAALAAGLAASGPAAAGISETRIAKTAECPADLEKALPDGRPLARGLGFTFFKDDGFKVEATSEISGLVVDRQPALLERVTILGIDPRNKSVLIAFAGDRLGGQRKYCGWIPSGGLVRVEGREVGEIETVEAGKELKPRLRKMSEVSTDQEGAGGNTLNAKALIQSLKADDEGADQKTDAAPKGATIASGQPRKEPLAVLYDKPGGAKIGSLKMFNIFYITDVDRPAGGAAHYLLAENDESVRGWVHEKDTLIWPSRMAVFWAGTGKALIYRNISDLTRASLGQKDAPPALYREPEKLELPTDEAVPRFPILGPRTKQDQLPSYYEIAFVGQGNVVLDSDQRAVQVQLARAQNIDILFVIDASESMDVYFKDVANAVERFSRRYWNNERVSVGAVVYGDYNRPGAVNDPQFDVATPLQRLDGKKHGLNALINWRSRPGKSYFDDPNHDKPEAMFAALLKAAKEAGWRDGMRFIVHIADHGSRLDGPNVKDVADAFAAQKITYLPVAVRGNFDRENNGAFAQQTQALSELNTWGKGKRLGHDVRMTYDLNTGVENGDRVEEITSALVDALEGQKGLIESVKQWILCAQLDAGGGAAPACNERKADSGNWRGQFIPEAAKALGIDQETIKRVYQRPQNVLSGFARTKDQNKKDLFSHWVALDEASFSLLRGIFDNLCVRIRTTDSEKPIVDAVNQLVASAGGDERLGANETFGQFFQKTFYIPAVRFKSRFVQLGPEKLARIMRSEGSPEEKLEHIQTVCRTAILLQMVQNGRKAPESSIVWDKENNIYQVAGETKYRWLYRPQFGLPLYFVPLEYLP